MIIVENTMIPGKVYAMHTDYQEDTVLSAYPAEKFNVYKGVCRIERQKVSNEDLRNGIKPEAPDIPAGLTKIR